MKVLRIVDWEPLTLGQISRGKRRPYPFVSIPTKLDSKTFRRISKEPNGAELYGCWIVLTILAAKSPVKGCVSSDSGPYTIEDVAIVTGFSTKILGEAIRFFIESGILEYSDYEPPKKRRVHGKSTVYAIASLDRGVINSIKIGTTRGPVQRRLESLQTGNDRELKIIGSTQNITEKEAHDALSRFRLSGEWFSPSPQVTKWISENMEVPDRGR